MRHILTAGLVILMISGVSAQLPLKFPSINEALSGHRSLIKPPTVKDFEGFTKDYGSHLAMLDRRSEKAYRKSFLKFIEIEDGLLYSLCDSNEFRAKMLVRSAMASYGKIEADKYRMTTDEQKLFYQKEKAVHVTASLSREILPTETVQNFDKSVSRHKNETVKTGSNLYAEYMAKRLRVYDNVFEDGTKEQRKRLRKLKRRARLWQAYKTEDRNLIARFADKHHSVMKFAGATSGFEAGMAAAMPDYSRALSMASETKPDVVPGGGDLLSELKQRFLDGGILNESEIESTNKTGELISLAQEKMNGIEKATEGKSENKTKSKKGKLPGEMVKAKRFWDRLYGGMDFDWKNPTGYYPEGLGLVLTGGYKISDNSGLNLEVNTLLNGSKMGFEEDKRFRSTLVSNYSAGANMDYRLWKFVFVGAGAEAIINNLEAPTEDYYKKIKNADFTVGLPIILRLIAPISAISGTNVEIRYDLNSKHNIKPNFDFRIGFLIGRR